MKKSKEMINEEMQEIIKKVEELDNITTPRLRESILNAYILEYMNLERKLKELDND